MSSSMLAAFVVDGSFGPIIIAPRTADTKEQVRSRSMIGRICEVLEKMQRSLASLKGEEQVGGQLRFCLSASIRSPQTSLGEREAREREWLFRRAASIRLTAAHRPVSGVPACW